MVYTIHINGITVNGGVYDIFFNHISIWRASLSPARSSWVQRKGWGISEASRRCVTWDPPRTKTTSRHSVPQEKHRFLPPRKEEHPVSYHSTCLFSRTFSKIQISQHLWTSSIGEDFQISFEAENEACSLMCLRTSKSWSHGRCTESVWIISQFVVNDSDKLLGTPISGTHHMHLIKTSQLPILAE